MSLDTFTNLKAAIGTHTDRTDIGDSLLTDLVTLADARIRKDLARHEIRLREMVERTDLSVSSGTATLPNDFMAMIAVQAQESDKRTLTYKPPDWLFEAYPAGDTAAPSFYTIEGDLLYMYPLTTSDIRIVYYAYPPALSTDNETNWLLTKYPDVYLQAAKLELRIYEEDEEGISLQTNMLSAAFDGLDKARFGSYESGAMMGASAYAT